MKKTASLTLPKITIGTARQIAWAVNIRLSVLREASELEDTFLAAAIPSMLAPIQDATVWIALSDYKHPGMPLTARILRMKSPQVARLQTVILQNLRQDETLSYMPANAPCLQQMSA